MRELAVILTAATALLGGTGCDELDLEGRLGNGEFEYLCGNGDASCNGVVKFPGGSSLAGAFTSAPLAINSSARSACPWAAAMCSGVSPPMPSDAFTSAPASTRRRAISKSPRPAEK